MRRWIQVAAAAALALTTAAPASAMSTVSSSSNSDNSSNGSSASTVPAASPHSLRPATECARVKCIALTFDDGPGPYTGKVLDILRAHRTKVTFFLVGGNVKKRPGTVRRMAREGHQIGNHTFDHPHLTTLYDDEIRDELSRTQDAIEAVTGRRPDLMRPPYGDTDARVGAVTAELGLAQILWNGSSRDWELRDPKALTAKVLGLAKRDRVVLMHDIQPHTVKALPKILSGLEKSGYHVVTIQKLLRGRTLAPGEVFPVGGWN
ncbi:polysaccharide deacetylase family protein [Sphaerisporangium album]|uniref:Polysaccharide deacetylase family protein n=1 Tax=Sphaerisporangium album TaxID=509200 RepID=A0A367F3Y1_9ACTN|nr:polysaccharide deacetylase family protein [Sphaerisporangium album]RCG24465.1 polysaccharide deacetylase family protein [Sphaerisporangium album]